MVGLLGLMAGCTATASLDESLNGELARQKVPGVAVAVVRGGEIELERGYGLANLELGVPVHPETIFQSGSAGKQFTAALVMLLVQDGLLALDDPLARHLPGTPASWSGITVRQLLTHTSGLADPYEKLDLTRNYTEAELLAIYGTVPLLFAPGADWSYSNMGYHALGFLASHVGGKFYGDQLVERLFLPAGMSSARVINERDIVLHRADGYDLEDWVPKNQTWVAPNLNTTGDGSIYLSVHDFARWDLALRQGTPLDFALQEAMRSPAVLSNGRTEAYGFGWALEDWEGHAAISHSGAWQGFTSMWIHLLDTDLSVIVLTNCSGADPSAFAALVLRNYL
ncbi:MAG: serine hydrolase domain-containing protein [Planctomycetota bacterium]